MRRFGLGVRSLVAVVAVLQGACRSKPVPASVIFEHVTLIDGTDRGPQADMSVAIEGSKIVAVGPSRSLRAVDSASRIDGTGMFVIPGLWDNHVHLRPYYEHAFPLFLANGVTTIRDVGDDIGRVGYLRQEIQYGRLLGPRLLIAGPTLDAPEVVNAVPEGRAAVPTPKAALIWVDSLAKLEVDLFKVHSDTPRQAYLAILARAKELKIPVAGHIPDSISPQEAIEAGQRTIEHDFRIGFANSPKGRGIGIAALAELDRYRKKSGSKFSFLEAFRIRLAAEDSVRAHYDSATAAAFAKDAARSQVWFDPTLAVLETQLRVNEPALRMVPELKYATKEALAFEDGLPPDPHPTDAMIAAGRARFAGILDTTFRELVRAKAKFLAGTDVPVMPLVPGFSLPHELELLVDMGLTPLEAIQAASRNGAQAAGRDDLGTIEAGKSADMVVLGADPLARVGNVRAVQMVVVRGKMLDRATLDRMLRDAEAFAKHQ